MSALADRIQINDRFFYRHEFDAIFLVDDLSQKTTLIKDPKQIYQFLKTANSAATMRGRVGFFRWLVDSVFEEYFQN